MKLRGFRWIWLEHVREHTHGQTLGPSASHVALALAVHYINGRNEGWPSQAELSSATGLSKSTVRRALHDLEKQRFITVRQGPPAHARGNVYRLLLPVTVTASANGASGHSDR